MATVESEWSSFIWFITGSAKAAKGCWLRRSEGSQEGGGLGSRHGLRGHRRRDLREGDREVGGKDACMGKHKHIDNGYIFFSLHPSSLFAYHSFLKYGTGNSLRLCAFVSIHSISMLMPNLSEHLLAARLFRDLPMSPAIGALIYAFKDVRCFKYLLSYFL